MTMGPEPMMRMVWMSVRLGKGVGFLGAPAGGEVGERANSGSVGGKAQSTQFKVQIGRGRALSVAGERSRHSRVREPKVARRAAGAALQVGGSDLGRP